MTFLVLGDINIPTKYGGIRAEGETFKLRVDLVLWMTVLKS